MSSAEAARLAALVQRKVGEVEEACRGLDEEQGAKNPPGKERWSVKQVISHLCGPEGAGYLPDLRRFVEEDVPRVDMNAGDPFYTGRRAARSLAALLSDLRSEYEAVARFVSGLREEELQRKAHIPMLRDSPVGEYPTLAQWVGILGGYHVDVHLEQIRTIRSEVG
jgi:hypothetical protein